MKIVDYYSRFISDFEKTGNLTTVLKGDEHLETIGKMAREWGIDLENVERWLKSPEYGTHSGIARHFIKNAPEVSKKVEEIFGHELVGEIRLSPSMMNFDGFARYDSGSHTVWFGVDHPDADENYLKALMAHELSHVYRDHRPDVWRFLGKPLEKVTRQEYLDNMSAHEHLVSEGLATLFSQLVYPEVPLHLHHYYFPDEMKWCIENFSKVDTAILNCLKTDQEIWKFYEEDSVELGSPSRTQYFWAARKLSDWIDKNVKGQTWQEKLVKAHGINALKFDCFK